MDDDLMTSYVVFVLFFFLQNTNKKDAIQIKEENTDCSNCTFKSHV